MPNYSYQGRNDKGQLIKGKVEADNYNVVASKLLETGITPVDIKEIKFDIDWYRVFGRELFRKKLKRTELLNFCRQMSSLYKAGVPITLSIARLAESARSNMLKVALEQVLVDIESGLELAKSLQKHKHVFPNLVVNIVEVGENTGKLDESFLQLANYLDLEDSTVKRVKAALRYPIIVISAIVIALVVLNMMVIPVFSGLFKSMKMELPLLTRVLIGTSDFTLAYWKHILLCIIILFILFRILIHTKKGLYLWNRFQIKIPFIGKILQKVIYARFARAFALILRTDVVLSRGIELVATSLNNKYMSAKVMEMRYLITRGESIINSAKATNMFSPLVLQMLLVGEEGGNIDEMLEFVADYYEREADFEIQRLSQAIEPVLMVIIGGLVLVLALGIFLPMWQMMRGMMR